jgi:ATP-dependent DNA helicase RecG
MSAIDQIEISTAEAEKLLVLAEGHFCDLKRIAIAPGKLTRTMSAFGNAEGGDLYIGIGETDTERVWEGFENIEAANGHIQAFEQLFPIGTNLNLIFLCHPARLGLVLKAEIKKTKDVIAASDGVVYVRRGAQNLPASTDIQLSLLKRNKGLSTFETETIPVPLETVTDSNAIIKFMLEVIPSAEPSEWLKKQFAIHNGLPTVGAIVLYADEPQAAIPKRCGIKVYRYQTSADVGTRETLAFDPISIEGHAYIQIIEAVKKTTEIIEAVRVNTQNGLEKVAYPREALHEIITNAVIHRDYSITDDIHITTFDNRVEVRSPGTLPAHITPQNILMERFARNPMLVRLLNKFPEPPNKDVGEGLNTAFEAMRNMRLKPPTIRQEGGYVKVVLRHESLATPDELILEFLKQNTQITNKQAREICFIGSENQMKRVFQRMIHNQLIKLVPGTTRYTAAYQLISVIGPILYKTQMKMNFNE